MEDSSDLNVEETPNPEWIDQIKESVAEVFESTNDVQDNGSFDSSISIREEESVDEVVKEVDLEKSPEIADVSGSGGDLVVPDTWLNEQIEESEASVQNGVVSDTRPDDDSRAKSESVVETDNVTEEIHESSTPSSFANDSAAAIDTQDKGFSSLASDDNETLGVESLRDGTEASPTAIDTLETGLEVSNLLHSSDNGRIPPAEADLGAKESEATQLQVLDSSKKEVAGPFYIELRGNADDVSEATGANAPVVYTCNDDGNTARTAEIAETKVVDLTLRQLHVSILVYFTPSFLSLNLEQTAAVVIFERKPCWASLLGCCGLSEAFHLSGR